MDRVTDFLKEIKSRSANPFLFSFFLSWLVINWRIVIGLFFNKSNELIADGYTSYIDLIEKTSNFKSNLLIPLLFATGYTFVFPFLRNAILIFNAWITSWGETWTLRVSKSGKISVSKYIQLRNSYVDRTKTLEEILEKESIYLQENATLRIDNASLANSQKEANFISEQWRKINDVKTLDGYWVCEFPDDLGGKKTRELYFSNGSIHEVVNNNLDKKLLYNITQYHANLETSEVFFFVRSPDQVFSTLVTHFYTMKFIEGGEVMSGKEDNKISMAFRRRK